MTYKYQNRFHVVTSFYEPPCMDPFAYIHTLPYKSTAASCHNAFNQRIPGNINCFAINFADNYPPALEITLKRCLTKKTSDFAYIDIYTDFTGISSRCHGLNLLKFILTTLIGITHFFFSSREFDIVRRRSLQLCSEFYTVDK